jgi:hypothetical protein
MSKIIINYRPTRGKKPIPPEGEISFIGRSTLGGTRNSYRIEDTLLNREWIKKIKATIARHQY